MRTFRNRPIKTFYLSDSEGWGGADFQKFGEFALRFDFRKIRPESNQEKGKLNFRNCLTPGGVPCGNKLPPESRLVEGYERDR